MGCWNAIFSISYQIIYRAGNSRQRKIHRETHFSWGNIRHSYNMVKYRRNSKLSYKLNLIRFILLYKYDNILKRVPFLYYIESVIILREMEKYRTIIRFTLFNFRWNRFGVCSDEKFRECGLKIAFGLSCVKILVRRTKKSF